MTCGWRCGNGEINECWTSPGDAATAIQEAVAAAAAADVTILAVGLGAQVEAEGCDRFNLTLPGVQQALQEAVSKVAKKLVLVVVSANGVDFDDSVANAVVWAPYGGQMAGPGLVDVLLGRTNPSARLPVTFYKQSWFDAMTNNISTSLLALDLEVGLGRTHRYVAPEHVKYWFGYGLSYTLPWSIEISKVTKETSGGLEVDLSVGSFSNFSTETSVVQVYLSGAKVPDQPTANINLVAFEKMTVASGQPSRKSINVAPAELQTAMADGTRQVVSGKYTLWACAHHPSDSAARAILGDDACSNTSITL